MIAATVCAAGLASCFHGSEPEEEADRMILMLRMMPVDADPVTSDSGVKEMIRSIRIILLSYGGDEEDNGNSGNNGEGIIEYNQRIEFENPSAVSGFRYDFAWPTFAGKKSLYIVANEESVTEGVRFLPSDGGTLPALSGSLTNLLDGYKAVGKDHLADPAAQASCAELVHVLDAVAFKPAYTVEDGEVFLPYVSYYSAADDIEQLNIKKGDYIGAEAPFNLYLVPVATKFTFHFENYRPHAVEINDITLSSAHSENFLMARVGEADYKKPFGDISTDPAVSWQDYYWIDWLAKVSEASHNYPGADDNRDFNAKYGWISHYAIPDGNTPERKTFVQKTDQQRVAQAEVVPGDETDGIPSTLTLGPFYLPESRNIARKSQNNIGAETGSQETDSQQYYLTLGLHDVTHQSSEYDPKFEEQPIDNLEALFRNTHVKINVVLRQGNIRVYAEIAEWSPKSANGWVAEGPEPKQQ